MDVTTTASSTVLNHTDTGAPAPVSVHLLEWDTAFFGARMGRLDVVGPMPGDEGEIARVLRTALAEARLARFDHVILRSGPAEPMARAAELAGLQLVDVGLDLRCTLPRGANAASGAMPVRPFRPSDLPSIEAIAGEAFRLGRFWTDPFFRPEQARDFYQEWARNLCRGLAAEVLVAEWHGEPAGFVSCALNDGTGRIPLIAMAAEARGLGGGQALVSAAVGWFERAGASAAYVRTQAHNYPALGLYVDQGFRVATADLTFAATLQTQRGQA